jgi:hypothetical protein
LFEHNVYNSNPRKEEEQKENNHREIANIPAEQLQRYIRTSSTVQAMSMCRGTAYSASPAICEL